MAKKRAVKKKSRSSTKRVVKKKTIPKNKKKAIKAKKKVVAKKKAAKKTSKKKVAKKKVAKKTSKKKVVKKTKRVAKKTSKKKAVKKKSAKKVAKKSSKKKVGKTVKPKRKSSSQKSTVTRVPLPAPTYVQKKQKTKGNIGLSIAGLLINAIVPGLGTIINGKKKYISQGILQFLLLLVIVVWSTVNTVMLVVFPFIWLWAIVVSIWSVKEDV